MPNKPFYHSEFESGLEKIALEQPEAEGDVLERVFNVRTKSLKATIRALLKEIQIREHLDIHLISQIEKQKSQLNTQIINLHLDKARYMGPFKDQIYVMRTQLRNSMLELDRQKRAEYLQCWHDLLGLKRELLIALREFWDLTKNKEILLEDLNEYETSLGD